MELSEANGEGQFEVLKTRVLQNKGFGDPQTDETSEANGEGQFEVLKTRVLSRFGPKMAFRPEF